MRTPLAAIHRASYNNEFLSSSRIAENLGFGEFGAPRSMKMGTIPSPRRYDVAAEQALQSPNLQGPAILRYSLIAGRAWPLSTVLRGVKRVPAATPVALSSRYSLGFPTCCAKGDESICATRAA